MDNEKQFAIKLADNEKKTRDRALAKIRRYIEARVSTNEGKKCSRLDLALEIGLLKVLCALKRAFCRGGLHQALEGHALLYVDVRQGFDPSR